jgi:hypothetical protein
MINHCDRRITLLSDTEISFGLFYLFTYFDMPFGWVQYSQRHTMINHCDRRITLLGDLNTSFVLLNIFSKFLLHLECCLLSDKRQPKIVVPGYWIRFRYFIFEIFAKMRVMQFFYLLCSQFRQKASCWINKTLLLIKQQKWFVLQ